ncbi:Solute carrier family 25 member 42 [Melipona quadrifasciata]|uniref:Solute carrier family 25 member 42 n=1 Tax=Melipona quadrifasciata TaxID=166423 RepID=A0A0N0BBC7_9HYME|nr:Solute carrier family 25 member 42 [Melipona quadrifasciata]
MSILSNSTEQVLQSASSLSMEKQNVDITKKQEKKVESDGISNTQKVWTSLISGAIAGALAKTTIAPLDRTKINFQISNQPFSANAAIKFLIKTLKTEGLLSLWRGNSATMVRIVPYSAVQFTAHEQWKGILGLNGLEREKPGLNFLAGSLAGITSQGITYPLDLMRARMAVTQKTEYKTLRQTFVRIYVEEGILAYYRGFSATMLGVIPYAGCSFFTYDLLRNLLAGEFFLSNLFYAVTVLTRRKKKRDLYEREWLVYDRKAGYPWGTSGLFPDVGAVLTLIATLVETSPMAVFFKYVLHVR